MHKTITLADAVFFGIEPEKVSSTLIKQAKKHPLHAKAQQITWVYHKLANNQDRYQLECLAQVLDKDLFWYNLQQAQDKQNHPDPYLQTR